MLILKQVQDDVSESLKQIPSPELVSVVGMTVN